MNKFDREIRKLKRVRNFGTGGALLLGAIIGLIIGNSFSGIWILVILVAFSWWIGVTNEISDKERGRTLHGRRDSTDR